MAWDKLIIGTSRLKKNYDTWLYRFCPEINIIDFSVLPPEKRESSVNQISGLLIPGGGDVDPDTYGRADDANYCTGIDKELDALEIWLVTCAIQHHIPVLGICRGMQVINVAMGGTLIPDITVFTGSSSVHRSENDVNHSVTVRQGTTLHHIVQQQVIMVNSAHHQAVDRLAKGFIVSALSADGVIEAIELNKEHDLPFCMAVQWHPERMNIEDAGSGLLGRRFFEEVLKKEQSFKGSSASNPVWDKNKPN